MSEEFVGMVLRICYSLLDAGRDYHGPANQNYDFMGLSNHFLMLKKEEEEETKFSRGIDCFEALPWLACVLKFSIKSFGFLFEDDDS